MKKTKSRKVIFTISIFVLILSYFLFSLYTKNRNKKLEIEKSLPYNFENFTIPEVTDFSDILTNYAKTLEKTPIYDNSNLLKEKKEISGTSLFGGTNSKNEVLDNKIAILKEIANYKTEKEKDFYCSIEAEYVIYVKEEIAKKNYYNSLLILHDLNFEDGCKAAYFIDDNYNLCFGLLKTINYEIPKYYEKEELENLKSKYNNLFNDNKLYDIFYDYNENSVINIKKDLVFEEIKNYLENGYKNEEVIASEKIAKKIIENKESK